MSFLAERFSPFFKQQLQAGWIEPQALQTLVLRRFDADVIRGLLGIHSLRRTRTLTLMTLMERDLQGSADLHEVCSAMTSLGEIACDLCFKAAAREVAERYGQPLDKLGKPQDLIVIAMGKAGANELNVSSDLDLILVYRDQGETDGSRSTSANEFFHQVARLAINELSELRADGFVFRIDTRLRPNCDSGPLVASLPMLDQYFQVQGREWERFAWLKARVICDTGLQAAAGLDPELDRQELNSIVEPFVFRRYIDYRVFDGLKGLHQLIRQEASKKDLKAPGTIDIKLGEGGIREIEFIAQMFQIVRGGRDSGLRNPATLTTLAALAQRKLISASEAQTLSEAYVFFRRIEHALQYIDDQQTHRLAAPGESRLRIAQMLKCEDDFDQRLQTARAFVQSIFGALLRDAASKKSDAQGQANAGGGTDEAARQAPATTPQAEFSEAVKLRLEQFTTGVRYRSSSPETQHGLNTLLEQAQVWLHEHQPKRQTKQQPKQQNGQQQADVSLDGDTTLIRLIDFAEVVCRRPSYIALVVRFPLAFERLLEIISQSSWAANYLNKHPIVLDELLDGRVLDPPNLREWQEQLQADLKAAARTKNGVSSEAEPDVERQMDLARETHHALVFKLLAQDLKGLWTIERLSDQLSEAADRTLQTAIDLCWAQLPKRFRERPQIAAIAYGKLGGKELGYASDLDLVFLHEDEDGRAQEAYSQLAQRVSNWLSTRTASGILFEIDLRLRPNGNAGLLVTSLKGFERYQRENAWTWELQALTRARFSAGDAAIGERFEKIRASLICAERDPTKLKADVIAMRQKMLDGHPNKTTLFDLKHDRGGMVDIEFMVQYLVLAHAHLYPELAKDIGNIALLGLAADKALIGQDISLQCQEGYRVFRKHQHRLRLNDQEFARIAPDALLAEREQVLKLWDQLFG
jgi:[glutamine synthetase] adenylyltransferase / [glutamine synthetase]-adenylyl-L-tyrosine phosphorylase